MTYDERLAEAGRAGRLFVTSGVIDLAANLFEVSKQSAAIRMLESGHSEAEEYCGDSENI